MGEKMDTIRIKSTLKRTHKKTNITTIAITIKSESSSETFKITDGEITEGVKMEGGEEENSRPSEEDKQEPAHLPNQQEQKTYEIKTTIIPNTENIESIEIYPIINGKTCPSVDKLEIKQCPE